MTPSTGFYSGKVRLPQRKGFWSRILSPGLALGLVYRGHPAEDFKHLPGKLQESNPAALRLVPARVLVAQ